VKPKGASRVGRGGSFFGASADLRDPAADLRAAYRSHGSPGNRYNDLGLRPVLDIPKEKPREK